jgi:phosphohistidine phosphatase
MAEVVLMRHGKSDWGAAFDRDAARPLSARGRRAATTMGRVLSAVGKAPDFVLSSPAVRAHSTAEMAAAAGGWNTDVHILESLYGNGPKAVVDALRSVPPVSLRVLVVGHEPSWSETVAVLTGGGTVRMPTGAAAGLEVLVGSWEAIGPGTCRLAWLLPPRLFTDGDLVLPD